MQIGSFVTNELSPGILDVINHIRLVGLFVLTQVPTGNVHVAGWRAHQAGRLKVHTQLCGIARDASVVVHAIHCRISRWHIRRCRRRDSFKETAWKGERRATKCGN